MLRKYIDFKLLKYLAAFYTVLVIISTLKKVYLKTHGFYETTSWYALITYNIILDWVIVLVFMVFISNLTKKMFEKWSDWRKILAVHLFFSFFIGYFIFFVAALIIYLLGDYTTEQVVNNVSFNHFMLVVELNFLVYFSMIGIINVYYYIKKVKDINLQKSQLETQIANTRLKMLKSQLHPHFMFNTLNTISSLIEEDKEKSQNLIADFGDLFREILEFKDQNLISLKQELSLLDKYIAIISVRFSDHLVIRKYIEPGLENVRVPSLIIQPLLENAVKYGYSYNVTELNINLKICKEGDYLSIHIENDGTLLENSFDELLSQGLGIQNTNDRLQTLFGNDHVFIVRNNEDSSGVEALVKIPFSILNQTT